MSKMVSARIPDALFDQGCARLEELGATQTQLVKAAFDYLLEERSLPQVSRKKRAVARRRLTKEQKQTLAASWPLASWTLISPPMSHTPRRRRTECGRPSMKLFLDTNALIDLVARREPYVSDVGKLCIAAYFGDVQLWASTQSYADAYYGSVPNVGVAIRSARAAAGRPRRSNPSPESSLF